MSGHGDGDPRSKRGSGPRLRWNDPAAWREVLALDSVLLVCLLPLRGVDCSEKPRVAQKKRYGFILQDDGQVQASSELANRGKLLSPRVFSVVGLYLPCP